MTLTSTKKNWKRTNLQVFWGEIAPCDHVVQIYENDKVFLDTLEGYVGTGIIAGDSVILLATTAHLTLLEERLVNQGFDLESLRRKDQLITLDAHDALARFMVNDWPDEQKFLELTLSLINRARKGGRRVRAFGEMVAVLWEKGLGGATVQLENLWNTLNKEQAFTLFCSYPRVGFTQQPSESLETICACHNKVINGDAGPSTEIYYRNIE